MKKTVKRIAVVLSIAGWGTLCATSEFRTPLNRLERNVMHYPFDQVDEAWWYHEMFPEECKDCLWNVDTWGAYYARSADKAYYDKCSSKTTTKKQPLSYLWFGQECFTVEQAFEGGMLPCDQEPINNPFIRFSKICPSFDYNEHGAYFGIHAERQVGCSGFWRVGARLSIPVKVVEVEQNVCKLEEDLNDVAGQGILNIDAENNSDFLFDYAYRLDLLTCIVRNALDDNPAFLPILRYGPVPVTGPGDPNPTMIAGKVVGSDNSNNIPIYLIKSTDGSVPDKEILSNTNPAIRSFAKLASQVNAPLPANGAGTDGQVFHFGDANVNYATALGTDRAAQSTLFVVPHLRDDLGGYAGANGNQAAEIQDAIQRVLDTVRQSGDGLPTEFLRNRGIDLCKHERNVGVGDLYAEIYGGCLCECWYANAILGMVFPTGKKHKDAKRVFFQPTGNHNHFEIRLGLEGGMRWYDWFAVRGDAFYGHAFKRSEHKAAAFKGATIKNIGTDVKADVSWNYFIGHLELNLFHPCNNELGTNIGYELYVKSKDSVSFCKKTAKDLVGNLQTLDACVLEKRTDVLSHKLYGDVFHRWSFFELYLGGSSVLAGKNVMQETEVHIGTTVYF